MRRFLLLLFAIVISFGLTACKDKKEDSGKQILNWNVGSDPKTLDPGLNGASDGGNVINNTFEGLVREQNGKILPGMAESWVISEDGKTVTFTIRDDAKWSDGTPLNADDFVRSWLRGMDPRNASEYSWIWDYTNVVGASEFANSESEDDSVLDSLRDAVDIKSIDNGHKLEVHLVAPTNWFISLMAFYHFMPVPESATIESDGAWAKDPTKAISNGPFKLVEYTVGNGLKLVKNDNYWNADNVKLDEINGSFIELQTTSFAKYYAGELDVVLSVPSAEVPRLIAESDEFHVFPLLGTYYFNFNLTGCDDGGNRDIGSRDNSLWCNVNLRKALALSIDREAITNALGAGQIPAAGFIPPGFVDNEDNDFYETSKDDSVIVTDDSKYDEAKTLFATAADELNMSVEELRTALSAKVYTYNTSENHQLVAEMIQADWSENLGFEIQLSNEAFAIFQDDRTNGNFDLSRGGWLTDFMDPSGMLGIFAQGVSYNDCDYNNTDFEAKLDEAKTATTAAAHFQALYDAHQIFMDDMPIVPIYHYVDQVYIKSYVTGWSRSVLGSVDFTYAEIDK